MKILLASTYLPPLSGGAEKVVWESAQFLAQQPGYDVHLVTTMPYHTPLKNVTVHTLPRKKKPTIYYELFGRAHLEKIFKQHNFDIIHSHMTLPWGFLLRKMPAKKVITLHGCEYLTSNPLYRALVRATLKKTDAVVSPSAWLQKFMQKTYGTKPLVIPNGVDSSVYKASKKTQKKNIVLFVGRLVELKGIRELLAAAKQLPEYEFWFAGDGPLADEISLPNTRFSGYLTGPQLRDAFQEATIVVSPSYKENFPTIALETLLSGRALIATKQGFSEIIEHNKEGILIEPKNVTQLTAAIKELMTNQTLRQRFEKSAKQKGKKYDQKQTLKQYLKLYGQLVN